MAETDLFKWRHYESEIILLCVRWYLRYALSYRDLEEMMNERGLSVSFRQLCYQGLLGLRLPSLTKRVISEERIALTPRVTQPSDRRATPCAQADSPPMRRLRVAAVWPPRSSAD